MSKLNFGLALLLGAIAALPSVAQDFPVTRLFSAGVGNEYHGGSAELIVPDTDTSVPAYQESRLRRYDVHIAKMFEVTHFQCQQISSQGRREGFISWEYRAAGRAANMGKFSITCNLAADIAQAYGVGRAEPTVIARPGARLVGEVTETYNVPILKIDSPGKIDRWLNFTANFRPR